MAVTGARMGRPSLGVRPTTVRLSEATIARVEKIAGPNRLAGFIRDAVNEKLDRDEKR